MTTANWLPYREARPGLNSTVTGDVRVLPAVGGQGLRARDILVYLPPDLDTSRRYPVLYMHDGQNVFDAATSFAGEWGVDEAAEAAGAQVIVVAIPNAEIQRGYEYSPWESRLFQGGGGGDVYLQYLAQTVRPLIESEWPVRTDAAGRGIAGSSLGGLISLYAALERPGEYGVCGAFSPALVATPDEVFDHARLAATAQLRVYMDVGRREAIGLGEVGADGATPYVAAVRRMRDLLTGAGADVLYVEDDLDHNEPAWRQRFPGFLEWALTRFDQGAPNTTR